MLVSLSAFSAALGLLGREPPTTVNWAPRKIALGSKFDIETSGSCYERANASQTGDWAESSLKKSAW